VGPALERTVIDHLLEGAEGGDRADRAPEIGLFRHALIRPVADRSAGRRRTLVRGRRVRGRWRGLSARTRT